MFPQYYFESAQALHLKMSFMTNIERQKSRKKLAICCCEIKLTLQPVPWCFCERKIGWKKRHAEACELGVGEGDSVTLHYKDIHSEGGWICLSDLHAILVQNQCYLSPIDCWNMISQWNNKTQPARGNSFGVQEICGQTFFQRGWNAEALKSKVKLWWMFPHQL